MHTRPWAEGDRQRLQEAGPSFSVDTLTSRFLTGNTRLPSVWIAAPRRPEPPSRTWLGQVALVDGVLVGMAECAWLPGSPQPGELVVLVVDGWQRRGVGRLVVDGLLDQVEATGITHIEAVGDAANTGCHALARSIDRNSHRPDGWAVRSWSIGGRRHFELRRRGGRQAAVRRRWVPARRVAVASCRSRTPRVS